MKQTKDRITIEFYINSVLPETMIGAVEIESCLPDSRKTADSARVLGKAICKVRHLDVVDAVILDRDGEQIDLLPVHR